MNSRVRPFVVASHKAAPSLDPSAAIELSDTNRGFLPNRVSGDEQRAKIETPVEALLIYNMNRSLYQTYDGNNWREIVSGIMDKYNNSTIVGAFTGYSNSVGAAPTMYGAWAGVQNTGDNATAIGYGAGVHNTGTDGTFVGKNVGQQNTGTYASFYGSESGQNNTGDFVVGVGPAAAQNNTAGYATFMGHAAGVLNTGDEATAVGTDAGSGNTGPGLAALGSSAGRDNTGLLFIGIGSTAGYVNSGDRVIAIGTNAAQNNSGDNVIAIGTHAAKDNTIDSLINIGDELVGVMGNNDPANPPTFMNDLAIAGRLRLAASAPTNADDPGKAGSIAWDDTHIYVCVADDTWVRADLATW